MADGDFAGLTMPAPLAGALARKLPAFDSRGELCLAGNCRATLLERGLGILPGCFLGDTKESAPDGAPFPGEVESEGGDTGDGEADEGELSDGDCGKGCGSPWKLLRLIGGEITVRLLRPPVVVTAGR